LLEFSVAQPKEFKAFRISILGRMLSYNAQAEMLYNHTNKVADKDATTSIGPFLTKQCF
jgi:hypothetical protein